jgi:Bax protein
MATFTYTKNPEYSDIKMNFKQIHLYNLSDIQEIKDEHSVPRVIYSMANLKLDKLSIPTKKRAFINIMLPTAMIVQSEIELERNKIQKMIDGKIKKNDEYLSKMYKKYRVKDQSIVTLHKKMKPVPVSILLGQAAIESGWGTSRLFREANNIFGVWSTEVDEPRIKANEKRGNWQVYLKKYPDLKKAIEDYMHLLARHKAYSEFREKLQYTTDYKILVPELINYSEQGVVYTDKISATIKSNKFYEYDHYEFIE